MIIYNIRTAYSFLGYLYFKKESALAKLEDMQRRYPDLEYRIETFHTEDMPK